MNWTGWTPSQGEIMASDSGKSVDFWLTSRFSIVRKESDYLVANLELICNPDVVFGRIFNVEPAPPDSHVVRYEGSGLGKCIIQNGQFDVTINIVSHPSHPEWNRYTALHKTGTFLHLVWMKSYPQVSVRIST
jgi:hypothetical protein